MKCKPCFLHPFIIHFTSLYFCDMKFCEHTEALLQRHYITSLLHKFSGIIRYVFSEKEVNLKEPHF